MVMVKLEAPWFSPSEVVVRAGARGGDVKDMKGRSMLSASGTLYPQGVHDIPMELVDHLPSSAEVLDNDEAIDQARQNEEAVEARRRIAERETIRQQQAGIHDDAHGRAQREAESQGDGNGGTDGDGKEDDIDELAEVLRQAQDAEAAKRAQEQEEAAALLAKKKKTRGRRKPTSKGRK